MFAWSQAVLVEVSKLGLPKNRGMLASGERGTNGISFLPVLQGKDTLRMPACHCI